MPPKKKAPIKSSNEPQLPEQKLPVQQQKFTAQTTTIKQDSSQKRIEHAKQQSRSESKKQQKTQNNASLIVPISRPALTEQQILRLRREKFKNSTKINFDEDQKVREQRMKKFGAQPKQTQEQIEERKKKFGNPSTSILTEDEQILRQRKMKFASSSIQLVNQSADVLEERKKKFAKKEQNLISLDQQIQKARQKSKKIRKDRKFRGKDRKERKLREERRRSNPGNKIGKKSRKQIFGKKKFIKRIRNKTKTNNRSE